jgi:hypothetical protein
MTEENNNTSIFSTFTRKDYNKAKYPIKQDLYVTSISIVNTDEYGNKQGGDNQFGTILNAGNNDLVFSSDDLLEINDYLLKEDNENFMRVTNKYLLRIRLGFEKENKGSKSSIIVTQAFIDITESVNPKTGILTLYKKLYPELRGRLNALTKTWVNDNQGGDGWGNLRKDLH